MRRKISAWKRKIKNGVFPTCILCGEPITSVGELSQEHILPLSRGGTNDDSNLYPAHQRCNFQKGSMTLKEWVVYLRLKERENQHDS